MNNRLVASLLFAGALVFACGPRSHSSEASASSNTHHSAPADGSPLASSLGVTVGRDVHLAFHVTNATSKLLELRFDNGQTHDFSVLDSLGREVWRWSAGRMFTQALQAKALAAGQTLSFEDRWDAAERHGRFTAVATLASGNFPLERRIEFELP
jgi:Intracellular proteinase inhibitor